jgi:hypothetical protein
MFGGRQSRHRSLPRSIDSQMSFGSSRRVSPNKIQKKQLDYDNWMNKKLGISNEARDRRDKEVAKNY